MELQITEERSRQQDLAGSTRESVEGTDPTSSWYPNPQIAQHRHRKSFLLFLVLPLLPSIHSNLVSLSTVHKWQDALTQGSEIHQDPRWKN